MIPKPVPATIWKKYPNAGNTGLQSAADFGDLSLGGMQPMAGPIFRYNAATAGSGGFPAYYDGSWLINNRGANDGWWKEVKIRNDNQQMLGVKDWLPYNNAGTATTQQNSLVIGTQFGDDGALYMARYPVTCCRNNTNASSTVQIVKISFDVYEETDAPSVTAAFDPVDARQRPDVHGPRDAELHVDRPGQRRPGAAAGRRGLHRASRDPQRRAGPVGALDQPGPREPVHEHGHRDGERRLRGRVPLGRPRRQRRGHQVGVLLDQPPDTTTPPAGKVSAIVPEHARARRQQRWCSARSSRAWRRRTPARPPRR